MPTLDSDNICPRKHRHCSLYASKPVKPHSPLTVYPAPTSFCKCTCFTNSTIIPLDAPPPSGPQSRSAFLFSRDTENGDDGEDDDDGAEKEGSGDPPPATDEDESKGKGDDDEEDKKEYRAGNCNDCNRQFCLDYNLPICKKASMEDVFTTCFREYIEIVDLIHGRG